MMFVYTQRQSGLENLPSKQKSTDTERQPHNTNRKQCKTSQPGPSGLVLQKCDVFPGQLFIERQETRLVFCRRAKRVKKKIWKYKARFLFSDKHIL